MNGALWTFFIVGGKLKPSLSSYFWNPLSGTICPAKYTVCTIIRNKVFIASYPEKRHWPSKKREGGDLL